MPAAASPNVVRARRLLAGGAVGGHVAWLLAVAAAGLIDGGAAAASAAVGGAVTLAFFTIGQAVQVLVADAPAKRVLVAALASYGVRVTALGLLLMLVLGNADRIAGMRPIAVVAATVAVVFGWLGTEFWVYRRLRIPIYDEPAKDTGKNPG